MRTPFGMMIFMLAAAWSSSDCPAQNLLRQPESVVFDAPRERYLVSNKETGEIIAIDASMTQSYFRTGLSSCRGLTIVGDTVYAATSLGVFGISLADASTTMFVSIPGMQFLNDIAADSSGCLYVSDMNAGRIYRVRIGDQTCSTLVSSGVASCNGLMYDRDGDRLLVCLWSYPGYIKSVDLSTLVTTVVATPGLSDCDGLAVDNDGNIYISSWGSNSVYRYDRSFSGGMELVSSGHSGPADIYFNLRDNVLAIPNFNVNTVDFIPIAVAAADPAVTPPARIRLEQNFPNPFNPSTTIEFILAERSFTRLAVFDALGRHVATLVSEIVPAGKNRIVWDGKDDSGSSVAAGFYFYRVSAGDVSISKKMVLVK